MNFFEQAMQRAQEQRNAADRLVASGPHPCAFRQCWGFAVIHRATYGNCEWRITWLHEDMEPISHVDAGSFTDAVRCARAYGVDLTQEIAPE